MVVSGGTWLNLDEIPGVLDDMISRLEGGTYVGTMDSGLVEEISDGINAVYFLYSFKSRQHQRTAAAKDEEVGA